MYKRLKKGLREAFDKDLESGLLLCLLLAVILMMITVSLLGLARLASSSIGGCTP